MMSSQAVLSENCNSSPQNYVKTIAFNMGGNRKRLPRSTWLTSDVKQEPKRPFCVNNAMIEKRKQHSECLKVRELRRECPVQVLRRGISTMSLRRQRRTRSSRRSMKSCWCSEGYPHEPGVAGAGRA